ncbi:restriction endonuclease subunit S [Acetobacter sp.]|uniref:restriction endonuclease subunit S n=1 Tax=Acetobacter sp. TaxID=440 RepID=UPI0039EA1079
MSEHWRSSTWGEEISLEYGKSNRTYNTEKGRFRVYGSNGPIGWTDTALVNEPGVVLGRKGAYRGVQFSKTPFFVIDTAYYVKPKNSNDIKWLYYAIISDKLGEIDDGSPIPSTTRSAVYVREIDVPPIKEQKAIASILGSLDDKIDLNRRTNETLEAMARALFRDWFVDFGPTRAKMAGESPYLAPELWELFPDRLDDEGKPEGWHQKPISEHFSVSIGKTPPRKEREHFVSSGHGIPWLSIRDMGTGNVFVSTTSENLTPESVERFNIKIASEGTVLLSFKLTVGRVMIANQRISTNEAIAHLFSKKVPTNYTYCYLKNFDFDTLGSTSSIATAVNSQTIRDMPFLIPSNSILDEFSLITERIFEKLFINEKENNNLSQLRDLLLPKLMSGEISIRDAEKMVEDAA